MALNVKVGTLTQPGSTGNADITLAANFDPKAIIVWATPQTTDQVYNNDASLSFGFGTYRSSAVQQGYSTYYSEDTPTTSIVARGTNTDALLKLYSNGTTPTVDLEIDLVSMTTGSGSKVTINWVNLHTTASIRVHYMILGGSDITDAYVHSFALSTAAATQDVTVVAGFGQPDLVMWHASAATSLGDSATHCAMMFGVAASDTERYCTTYNDEDNVGTMLNAGWQKERAVLVLNPSTQAADAEADLASKASWPTDGYRLSFSDQATLGVRMIGLALKGTFTSTVGYTDAPTTVSTVNFDHGSTPVGALVFGTYGPGTSTSIDSSSAQLGTIGIGATDGTSQAFAGAGNNDNSGVADCGLGNTVSETYLLVTGATAGGGPDAQMESYFSGNNFVCDWTSAPASAHRLGVLTLGSAVAAAFVPRPINTELQAVMKSVAW